MSGDIDLRLLRSFVAVAEELHFGRAAARLFISQPALSQQIRMLEARLGLALFVRDRRRVTLAPAGAELLPAARRLLAAGRQFTSRAERLRASAAVRLVLGYQVPMPDNGLPRIVTAHRRNRPDVVVALRHYDFTDTSAGLVEGSSDVAVISLPVVHDLRTELLFAQPVVAMLPASLPLAHRPGITVEELLGTGLPWAQPPPHDAVWRDFWTAAGPRTLLGPRGRITVEEPPNVDSYVMQVSAGQLVGLTHAAFVPTVPGVALVPVLDVPPARFAVACRPDDARPAVSDLVATVRSELGDSAAQA